MSLNLQVFFLDGIPYLLFLKSRDVGTFKSLKPQSYVHTNQVSLSSCQSQKESYFMSIGTSFQEEVCSKFVSQWIWRHISILANHILSIRSLFSWALEEERDGLVHSQKILSNLNISINIWTKIIGSQRLPSVEFLTPSSLSVSGCSDKTSDSFGEFWSSFKRDCISISSWFSLSLLFLSLWCSGSEPFSSGISIGDITYLCNHIWFYSFYSTCNTSHDIERLFTDFNPTNREHDWWLTRYKYCLIVIRVSVWDFSYRFYANRQNLIFREYSTDMTHCVSAFIVLTPACCVIISDIR